MKNPKVITFILLICLLLFTYFYSQKKTERVMSERARIEIVREVASLYELQREVTDSLNHQIEIDMEHSGED